MVGEPAPEFTLRSLSGETISLADLRGQVVVLDFWATWCPPCRRGLPLLQQVHDWAVQNELPVKVFAVDVWERQSSHEETVRAVGEFWKQQGYTMTALLDLDGSAVRPYGFSSIPHTVVIGPDGRLQAVHQGFLENMVSLLQQETQRLLEG
jgi:thiol-disulfide isomerase/thioredoxin